MNGQGSRQTGASAPGSADGDHRSLALPLTVPTVLLDLLAAAVADELERRGLTGQSSGPEPWVGVAEAAEHLACPVSRIYDLVAQRAVRFCRDGRRLLFRRSDLDAYLQQENAA